MIDENIESGKIGISSKQCDGGNVDKGNKIREALYSDTNLVIPFKSADEMYTDPLRIIMGVNQSKSKQNRKAGLQLWDYLIELNKINLYLKELFQNKRPDGNYENLVGDSVQINPSDDNDSCNCSSCKPPYVTLTVHRSQLELLKYFIGSLNRPESVSHLAEEDRDVVAHAVQDFYQLICDELDKKPNTVPSNKNEYAKLTDEEEKLLKECFED